MPPPFRREAGAYSVSVDQVGETEWESLLPLFADASLYQTWAYGAVRWGQSKLSHLVLRRDGEVVAMAQLRIARLPVLPAGLAYLRWGPVCRRRGAPTDPEVVSQMLRSLQREYVEGRGLTLQVIPNVFEETAGSEDFTSALAANGLSPEPGASRYRTFLVDLRPPPEKIRAALQQKWRNQLNASERNGLQIEVSEEPAAYQTFLDLYAGMWARKQFDSSVDVHEFGRLQDRLSPISKMVIFTARAGDGEAVGSLVCSLIGETALYVLGATNERARELKAAYFLQWQALTHLKARGALGYDLGGANPVTNPGGHHFKKGFGGPEVVQLPLHAAQGSLLSRGLSAFAARRRTARSEAVPGN
jgi:lipid II:glycine glycyltransferase (peptidoglycan interpeptide bridge formation enzyme)